MATVLVGYFVKRTDRVAKLTQANMADQEYVMRLISTIRDDYWALVDWAYAARNTCGDALSATGEAEPAHRRPAEDPRTAAPRCSKPGTPKASPSTTKTTDARHRDAAPTSAPMVIHGRAGCSRCTSMTMRASGSPSPPSCRTRDGPARGSSTASDRRCRRSRQPNTSTSGWCGGSSASTATRSASSPASTGDSSWTRTHPTPTTSRHRG
jgi:hypothetical protein